MNIFNSNYYNNEIYKAIVVNDNYSSDPEQNGRVQIYLPDFQSNYVDIYKNYMAASNKELTGHQNKFPWAVTLVKDLKNGDIVYGNFINNESGKFIILGLQANINVQGTITQGSGYLLTGEELTKYTTAIIIENETGLDHNKYIDGDISDSIYGYINGNDNGAFSIGLIQWHANKAFNLLCKIRTNLPNWESYWTDKEEYIYQDLKANKALHNNYNKYKVTPGSSAYNSIRNMLISNEGKQTQLQHSSDDTYANITELQNDYGISNPAVIIFLSDLMNQYGSGIPETKNYARSVCGSTTNIMDAFNQVVAYCEANISSYSVYKSRRDNTIAYINSLNSQGKFSQAGLLEVGMAVNAVYCYPFNGSATITASWGPGGAAGGYSGGPHNGVDFAMPVGTPLYACTNGRIEQKYGSAFGNYTLLYADDGNLIIYAHQSAHDAENGYVTMGQLIGYSGNTGNSSGPHLHFGITNQSNGESGLYNRNLSLGKNPLPYLGFDPNVNYYDEEVFFE